MATRNSVRTAEPPKGKEANWIQTVPGKGWFTILRLYSPMEAYFDKSWQVSARSNW